MTPPLMHPAPQTPSERQRAPVAQPARRGMRAELRDLMWVVFGLDLFAAGILAYLAIILLVAVHDLRASLSCLLLGLLLFIAGAIPRWFPQLLTRAGLDNPLLLNPR